MQLTDQQCNRPRICHYPRHWIHNSHRCWFSMGFLATSMSHCDQLQNFISSHCSEKEVFVILPIVEVEDVVQCKCRSQQVKSHALISLALKFNKVTMAVYTAYLIGPNLGGPKVGQAKLWAALMMASPKIMSIIWAALRLGGPNYGRQIMGGSTLIRAALIRTDKPIRQLRSSYRNCSTQALYRLQLR